MINLGTLLNSSLVDCLGWTLVHFLWQGALVGAIYIVLQQLLSGKSPTTRYHLAMCTLGIMAILPIITFILLANSIPSLSANETWHGYAVIASAVGNPGAPAPVSIVSGLQTRLQPLIPWSVLLWMLGVSIATLRVFRSWRYAHRLQATATSLSLEEWHSVIENLRSLYGVKKAIRVAVSIHVTVPCVIGWLKPVILIPPSSMIGLTPSQMELILAHELAHICRMDYLWNLLQVAVETLLFYHPVVRWVSRQARLEREQCCDDMVIGLHGDAVAYARALAELESLRRPATALVLGADGGQVFNRIHRLFDLRSQDAPAFWMPMLAIAGLLLSVSSTQIIRHQVRLESITSTEYNLVGIPNRQDSAALIKSVTPALPPTRITTAALPMLDAPQPIRLPAAPSAVAPDLVQMSDAPVSSPPAGVNPATPVPHEATENRFTAAVFIETHAPTYPAFARDRGVEGSAALAFTVMPAGDIEDLHATQVTGSRLFAEAAMQALRQWKFKPATLNGRPVAQHMVEEFIFQLKPPSGKGGACKIPTGYHICLSNQ